MQKSQQSKIGRQAKQINNQESKKQIQQYLRDLGLTNSLLNQNIQNIFASILFVLQNGQLSEQAKLQILVSEIGAIFTYLIAQRMKALQINCDQIQLISEREIKYKINSSHKEHQFGFILQALEQYKNILKRIQVINKNKKIISIICLLRQQQFKSNDQNWDRCSITEFAQIKTMNQLIQRMNLNKKHKENQQLGFQLKKFLNSPDLPHKIIAHISNLMQLEQNKLSISQEYHNCITQQQRSKEHDEIEQVMVLKQRHENLCGFHAFHNIKQFNKEEIFSQTQFLQNYLYFMKCIQNHKNIAQIMQIPLFQSLEREDVQYLIKDLAFKQKNICTFFISTNYILNPPHELQELENKIARVRNQQISELFILMGVFSHYFVLKLFDHDKIMFIDSTNPCLQAIMNEIIPQIANKEAIQKMRDTKTALNSIKNVFHKKQSIKIILCRLRIQEIIGSYEKLPDSQECRQIWLQEQYPPPVIRNDLLTEIKEFKGRQLGQEYEKRLIKWLSQEFVKSKIVSQNQSEQILSRMDIKK